MVHICIRLKSCELFSSITFLPVPISFNLFLRSFLLLLPSCSCPCLHLSLISCQHLQTCSTPFDLLREDSGETDYLSPTGVLLPFPSGPGPWDPFYLYLASSCPLFSVVLLLEWMQALSTWEKQEPTALFLRQKSRQIKQVPRGFFVEHTVFMYFAPVDTSTAYSAAC